MAPTWLKKVTQLAVATAVLATSLIATAPTAKADVYTEPGTHNVNGRKWKTTCGTYSSTVTRCTTNIWATQVTYSNGRYAEKNGWVFNNLTYKPSPRGNWKNNPLAIPGNHTIDGRKWYTECDTAWTGKNACRSMIEATVYSRSGSGYKTEKKMVFNNIVLFTTGPTKPTTPTYKWYDLTEQKMVDSNEDGFSSCRVYDTALTIGTKYFPEALTIDNYSWTESAATADAVFALNGRCSTFEVYIGERSDAKYTSEPTLYRFYVDGQQKGATLEVAPFKGPKKVTVDVRNAVQLKLWTHHKPGGGDPAWGAPRIKCTSSPNPLD